MAADLVRPNRELETPYSRESLFSVVNVFA